MATGRGFFSGLYDFIAAPVRLWRMHTRLVLLNPQSVRLQNVQRHHREHAHRIQMRERLQESYSTHTQTSSTNPSSSSVVSPLDSGALFQPLLRMWLINVGLILFLVLLSQLWLLLCQHTVLGTWSEKLGALAFIPHVLSGILHICLPLFMEMVNTLYLKKICDRLALLKDTTHQRKPTSQSVDQSSSALGATIMDRVYALIFFVIFQLQWSLLSSLLSNYAARHLINVFAVAFMYACYAIEYRWRQVPGRTFEGYLVHILDHWTYFVGYGLVIGLGCQYWPNFIGSGGMFLSIAYPILVIGALGSRSLPNTAPLLWIEAKLSRLFRFALVLSMHPALFCTNLIVRGCVGAAYQLWF